MSCPNDHVASEPGHENPFHLRKYTFAEFRTLAEAALGPARAWLLGANTLGYVLIESHSASTQSASADSAAFLEAELLKAGFILPTWLHIPVTEDSVLFFSGSGGMLKSRPWLRFPCSPTPLL